MAKEILKSMSEIEVELQQERNKRKRLARAAVQYLMKPSIANRNRLEKMLEEK